MNPAKVSTVVTISVLNRMYLIDGAWKNVRIQSVIELEPEIWTLLSMISLRCFVDLLSLTLASYISTDV